jgi:hypothetical protein
VECLSQYAERSLKIKTVGTYVLLDVVFCTDVEIYTANHEGYVWQKTDPVAVKLKGEKYPAM